MTKLLQWISAAVLLIGSWVGILSTTFGQKWSAIVIPTPFFLLFIFVIYTATVLLYRVYTFNNCPDAAEEIKKQIVEARADLTQKGMKFGKTD